jgi:DNA polymerase-3 subunit delta
MAAETVKPLYVLHGEDGFLRDHHRAQIVERAIGSADPQLCVSVFDAEAELAAVLDELRTLPFLAPRRVVIVRDADDFVAAHREELERYLQEPCPSATLVLLVAAWPSNTRLYKVAAKVGGAIDCSSPQGGQLSRWLVQAAAKRGKKIDPDVAEGLADWIGNDLSALDGEMEKLSLYVGPRATITLEDISAVVTATSGPVAFALTNAITAGDAKAALEALGGMLRVRGDEFKVLGTIGWHLRRAMATCQKLRKGASKDQALPRMPYQQQHAFMDMIARRGPRRIMRDVRLAMRADLAMKTGAQSPMTLEKLVVGLCRS